MFWISSWGKWIYKILLVTYEEEEKKDNWLMTMIVPLCGKESILSYVETMAVIAYTHGIPSKIL